MKVGSNIVATESELNKLGITIADLQDKLTLPNPEYANMRRFGKGRFYRKIDTHICYLKKVGSEYIVPRYYNGEPELTDAVEGRVLTSESKIKLRDYQEEFVKKNFETLLHNSGILIEAPCGHGKTILGIWLSYFRSVQTMVLVPTYYLAKQWKQRIEECTNASVVILKSSDTKVPTDSDFTIVCMDLFSCRTLPKELINNIGHVILDEAHRVGAEIYLPILDEIPAHYRTALTATFRRTDGVHRILKYHFGEHIQMTNRFPRPHVYAVRTGVKIRSLISKNKSYEKFLDYMDEHNFPYHETKSSVEYESNKDMMSIAEQDYIKGAINKTELTEIGKCIKRGSDTPYTVIDSYLNDHSGRRKFIIRIIKECLNSGRTILFLSKRKDTLKALYKYFADYNPMLIISETNSRSEEDEKYLQTKCPLILGVTQLAKEGLDIDRLDTVIFHLPMKDTEQAIGRISRLCDTKKPPIGIYLLDDCPIAYAVYNNAKKFFKINSELKGETNLDKLKCIL